MLSLSLSLQSVTLFGSIALRSWGHVTSRAVAGHDAAKVPPTRRRCWLLPRFLCTSPPARQPALEGVYDYVVVGAGSAGCVLANRLSATHSRTLLLEAGGTDNYLPIHIPVGYLWTIGNPRTDWCLYTEPEVGLNGRRILYSRGKVVGGCSSINAQIAMRGQRADYDRWAEETGAAEWSWEHLLPVFRKLEDFGPFQEDRDRDFHGVGGPVRVENPRVRWPVLDVWADAAAECGIPRIREFNRGDNFGCAYFQVNQRRGTRVSMARAYLKPILHRENLRLQTHAFVQRIIFEGNRAVGVEWRRADGTSSVSRAKREVILAAGAIASPQLLMLSGVGDPHELERHAIPLRHPLVGVGKNLQDHLQLRPVFKVSGARTLNSMYHSWYQRLLMGLQYVLFQTGPLTMPPSTLGAFAYSSSDSRAPRLEWHVQPLSLPRFSEPLDGFDAITPSVCNLRPSSRGLVSLRSADAADSPKIVCNYLSTQDDCDVAVESLRFTRRIMSAHALQRLAPEEIKPGPSVTTDEELLRAAREIGTTIFHPVGTCRMGRPNDSSAVVDRDLRVIGLQGLRVVDASVMPTIVSGNTNTPTVAIAEVASEKILRSSP